MIEPDQITTMAEDVRELRQLLTQVRDEQPIVDVSGGSASGAARNFIAVMADAISKLDAQRVDVMLGNYGYDKWKGLAEDYKAQLKSQVGEAANYSFTNYAVTGVSQTAGEVAQDIQAIGDAAKSGTTWGFLAGVLTAAAILWVAVKL